MTLIVQERRIASRRGLVPLQNRGGRRYSTPNLCRWVRINRRLFGAQKVDLFASRLDPPVVETLVAYGLGMHVAVSLRTDCSESPPPASWLAKAGLLDVFLCPNSVGSGYFDEWLSASKEAGLPVRVELRPPYPSECATPGFVERLKACGVVAATIGVTDTVQKVTPCTGAEDSLRTLAVMNSLAPELEAAGIEATLYSVPLCLVTDENRIRAGNSPLYFQDHQQYCRRSLKFATRLYEYSPLIAGSLIQLYQTHHDFQKRSVDQWLAEWLVVRNKCWYYSVAVFLRKATCHLLINRRTPRALERLDGTLEERDRTRRERALASQNDACSKCCFRWVCDFETPAFNNQFPGIGVATQVGLCYQSPLFYTARQPKFYDTLDSDRIRMPETRRDLAERARSIMANGAPTLVRETSEYAVVNTHYSPMSSAVRWQAWTNTEKRTGVLYGHFAPYVTSYTVGAGMAEYAGFYVRSDGFEHVLVCPLISHSHELTLYSEADGRYVLLRDGESVDPTDFDGACEVPLRLPPGFDVYLSIWNIDERILTQEVRFWVVSDEENVAPPAIKYSVIVFCTRFARRLQAALQCVAHQRGIDLAHIEVIVGYVPGLDATDDIVDSMTLAHPELRIVRSPFTEHNAHAKGLVINRSAALASGEWIVLIDSDILLPPDMFARLDEATSDAVFLAPDGRLMLSPETTAKILLGELRPWESWPEVMAGSSEYRRGEALGIPIGFCQIFKKTCLEKVRYKEFGHFEGADGDFGLEMREQFGVEKRLTGMPVAHLDHGGSRWFGTQKQL